MFHFISGKLALLTPGTAVLETGGVGFKLTVSDQTYAAISPAARSSDTVKLYTYLAVREDGMELFGFHTEAELDTFKLLITVQGVGPKAAMSILSVFTPESFTVAVLAEDKKAIAKANGIGAKIAARILLDLHDKIAASGLSGADTLFPTAANSTAPMAAEGGKGNLAEAQEALLVLGYSRTEILGALREMSTATMSVEEIIRAALKKLM